MADKVPAAADAGHSLLLGVIAWYRDGGRGADGEADEPVQ